jgi:hypothetical protein
LARSWVDLRSRRVTSSPAASPRNRDAVADSIGPAPAARQGVEELFECLQRRRHPAPGGKTPVEKALRTQQAIADQYSRWRAAHPEGIDPQILNDNAGAFQVSDAALALQPAMDTVNADADAADNRVKDLMNSQKVATGDVAAQIAAQRFWARVQRKLDAVKEPDKLAAAARDLSASADDTQIPTLNEELPDYLESRSVPTGWLPDALADKILKARQRDVLAQNHAALRNAIREGSGRAATARSFLGIGRAVRRRGSVHETMSDITPEFLAGVSEWTGVPVNMLSGDTIPAVWDSAQRAMDWRLATAAPAQPATAAVPVPSANRIVQMRSEAPDDWMAAWRSGLLAGRGAPAPPPRRTGEHHSNAAP